MSGLFEYYPCNVDCTCPDKLSKLKLNFANANSTVEHTCTSVEYTCTIIVNNISYDNHCINFTQGCFDIHEFNLLN